MNQAEGSHFSFVLLLKCLPLIVIACVCSLGSLEVMPCLSAMCLIYLHLGLHLLARLCHMYMHSGMLTPALIGNLLVGPYEYHLLQS